jgi:hypothetical protein
MQEESRVALSSMEKKLTAKLQQKDLFLLICDDLLLRQASTAIDYF